MSRRFDIIVVGTGVAGSAIARRCQAGGRKVAIVDERPFGGTCQLRGCDPKKVLRAAAEPVPVPSDLISLVSAHPDQRPWPVVRGLEEAMIRAHASGGTLAEAGFCITADSR